MTDSTRDSIYEAIASIRLIDPHTHIDPHSPASSTLADLLGYHYYTELAHSAGMPKQQIEEMGIGPKELVSRLVENLRPIENTANYRWLVEICRMFFGFNGDRIDSSNWESLYDSAEDKMASADWAQTVLDQSNVESVFLTNDFDDKLEGFDTDTYIPCLRTDDLVFHLAKTPVQERLAVCSGIELDGSLNSLRASLRQRFEHFVGRGARACAISIPPMFSPAPVSDGRAGNALDQVLKHGELADDAHKDALGRRVFWTLAELCDEFELPFDLMIGVNRGVYPDGVYQGQDLYDSRVSLTQYRELFNAFPNVKFPVSVLASVTNQELVSHAWIFPNVITNGHWWYSNTPSFIARDAMARLEAVPQNKQIAYYSDAYKLEFVWPKFDMYRNVLADLLSDHFVGRCGWSEERAIELGRRILRDNVEEIFPRPVMPESNSNIEETIVEDPDLTVDDILIAGSSAALAAGAIGIVEVDAAGNQTVSEFDDAKTSELSSSSETLEMETVVEEFGAFEVKELADEEEGLADLPTLAEAPIDTVRIESEADSDPVDSNSETIEFDEDTDLSMESFIVEGDVNIDIDPLPSVDEVQSLEVADVQLGDPAKDPIAADAESNAGGIELDTDPEILDVGDLLSSGALEDTIDLETTDSDSESQIKMLRNEEQFQPDEDSLRLAPDPLTGELSFPVPDDSSDGDDDLIVEFKDLDIVEDTIDLDEVDSEDT